MTSWGAKWWEARWSLRLDEALDHQGWRVVAWKVGRCRALSVVAVLVEVQVEGVGERHGAAGGGGCRWVAAADAAEQGREEVSNAAGEGCGRSL